MKTQEKGYDVNVATYLLVDAFWTNANTFVVIGHDSDLMEPLRIVQHDLGEWIRLGRPHTTPSRALAQCQPYSYSCSSWWVSRSCSSLWSRPPAARTRPRMAHSVSAGVAGSRSGRSPPLLVGVKA